MPFAFYLRDVTDAALSGKPFDTIFYLSLVTLLIIVLMLVFTMASEIYGTLLFWRISMFLWLDISRKILRTPEDKRLATGEYMSLLYDAMAVPIICLMPHNIAYIVGLSFILYALIIISPILSVFLIPLIIVSIILMWRLSFEATRRQSEARMLLDDVMKKYSSILNGLSSFKSMGKDSYLEKKFRESVNAYMDRYSMAVKGFIKAHRIVSLIWWFAPIIFIIIGSILAAKGFLTIPDAIAFSMNVNAVVPPLQFLTRNFRSILGAKPNAKRLKEFLESSEEESGVLDFPRSIHKIVLDSVYFKYANSPKYALENISFCINEGEWLAIVGDSGAGKTTLVKLIPHLLRPTRGTVRINSVDVRDIKKVELRRNIIYLSSNEYLFEGSVRENLRLDDSIRDEEIWKTLEICGIDFVSSLDDAIDERGSNLSEGQRQRLALARALLRKPKVLILDEALSGVDSKTEGKILHNLRSLDITVIIVSHRLSAIMSADRIIVLHGGRVVCEGKHHDLVRSCEHYRMLIERQIIKE